jgi:GNAT superfamily N-acetyltransferase
MARSEREIIFVERIGGRVESCCVVSLDPGSLNRRLIFASLPRLLWDAWVALFTRPPFRRYLRSRIRELVSGASKQTREPEITYVFTNASLRGSGLGRRLIDRVDAFFRAKGYPAYYVRTIDAPDNRALDFYDRNGFVRIGTTEEGGRSFVEFERLPVAS